MKKGQLNMAFKIFVDANVLLDLSFKRDGYNLSKQLIQEISEGKFRAFSTSSIVHIISHWLTKHYGSDEAKAIILDFLKDITIIDCSHTMIVNALNSNIRDIEDALQYYTALQHKIDYFISSDKALKKSAIPSLPVYSTEDFLATFSN